MTGPLTARAPAAASRGSAALLAAYLACCAISLLPFLLIDHPPITDFPNHAARLWIACAADDPVVAGMYRYSIGLIPNLAADLVNLPLCGLVAPGEVLKLVTAGSLATIYLCGWLIQRRLHGAPNFFLLMLPALSFNVVTTLGYVNFLAGVAVSFLLLVCGMAARERRLLLLLLGNVGGLAIFFCHIFALAFAMIATFGLMLGQGSRDWRGMIVASFRTLLLFALPLVLIPFVQRAGGGLGYYYYGGKARLLIAPFLGLGELSLTVALVMLALIYLALRSHRATIEPVFRLPLLALAIYILAVPGTLQDAVDIDSRTLVATAYLFFVALKPTVPDRRLATASLAVTAMMMTLNLAIVMQAWLPFDAKIAEFRQSLDVLPPQAKVVSVIAADRADSRALPLSAYFHLASYAIMDRRIFNPLEFTGVGMQPLSAQSAFSPFDTPTFTPVVPKLALMLAHPTPAVERSFAGTDGAFALRWTSRFDYVIYYHFGAAPNFDPAELTLVRDGSFYSILKVNRAQGHPSDIVSQVAGPGDSAGHR